MSEQQDAIRAARQATRTALAAAYADDSIDGNTADLENAAYDAAEAAGLDLESDEWVERICKATPTEILEHLLAALVHLGA